MNYIPYKYDNLMKENLIINFLLGKIQKGEEMGEKYDTLDYYNKNASEYFEQTLNGNFLLHFYPNHYFAQRNKGVLHSVKE